MSADAGNFWQQKSLAQLNHNEWEALCDGCGRCCLVKLEDEDSGELVYTNVACRLLDLGTCRCSDYAHRRKRVPDCLVLNACQEQIFPLLPYTCAYRCLFENRPLPSWHPLISGTSETVSDAGISVGGKVVSEEFIHPEQLEDHVVDWISLDADVG